MSIPFAFMVCNCSFRSLEEQEKYGSYCEPCWKVVSISKKCKYCDVPVEKERLYVSCALKVILCKQCFLDLDIKTKLFLKRVSQGAED